MFSTTTTTPENDSSRPDLIRDRQGQHDGIESIKLTKQDIQVQLYLSLFYVAFKLGLSDEYDVIEYVGRL
jgi:hypothetical protein